MIFVCSSMTSFLTAFCSYFCLKKKGICFNSTLIKEQNPTKRNIVFIVEIQVLKRIFWHPVRVSLLSLILSGESFRICWSCGWGGGWGWFRGKEILRSANFKHMFPPSIGGLCFCLFVHIQHCLSGLGWKILDPLLRDEKKRFWWRTFLSCASQLLSGALLELSHFQEYLPSERNFPTSSFCQTQ